MNFGEMPPAPEQQERPTVPEHEIHLEYVRSSGPGGQNVNKVSSKAQLRWSVGASQAFTDKQKAAIRAYAGNRLNKEGEIFMADGSERSQLQNRENVIARLQELVAEALTPKEERKPTKVPRGEKEQRLGDKRRDSFLKKGRQSFRGDE